MAEPTLPPDVTPMTCPKCGAVQGLAVNCRKCGLTATLMPKFREQDAASQHEAVTSAWIQVELNWNDPGRHEKFAAAVVEHRAFAFAARQYRAASAKRAGDTIGPAQIEKLGKMAEAALKATAVARPEKGANPYKKTTMLLVACVVAVVFGLLYAVISKKSSSGGELTPIQDQPRGAKTR
jgi:ribosomal protein L40E